MLEEKELQALITLLDDSDPEVFDHVYSKLKNYGPVVIKQLEDAWENSFNPDLQTRIEELIQSIQVEQTFGAFQKWLDNGAKNLMEAALIIEQVKYPEHNRESFYQSIEKYKTEIWIEFTEYLTSLEKVSIMNHILFQKGGFIGNMKKLHDIINNFMHVLVSSKKGNSFSLSIFYQYLAEQTGLILRPIVFPNHMILVGVNDGTENFNEEQVNEQGFYIDPFSRGTIFSQKEIDEFVQKVGLEKDSNFFYPMSNTVVIKTYLQHILEFSSDEKESVQQHFHSMLEMIKEEDWSA